MTRREQEISEKKAALDDMKRKNRLVQDKVEIIVLSRKSLKLNFRSKSKSRP